MQFVDHVRIIVESGAGGDGIVAWRREKFVSHGGPYGGDGGDGGSIYVEANSNMHTLLDFKYRSEFKGNPGERGRNKNQHGKSADDIVIKVPCGTIVYDAESSQPIADLIHNGDKVLVASGGRGGRGNSRFVSSRRQAPQFAEPGEPGIRRELSFELKLLADVGIIGLPNAGKSTLISVISAAKPKIADYPFTTLTPNLGVVRRPSGDGIVVADIPGLIEGASEGIGLGHDFLRHVERTRLLLHLVDVAVDPEDEAALSPLKAHEIINEELAKYSPKLAKKPQILVLTKQDAVYDTDAFEKLKTEFQKRSDYPVVVISSIAHQGVDGLLQEMFDALDKLPRDEEVVDVVVDTKAFLKDDSEYEVELQGNSLVVMGGKVDRLMRVTDLRNPTAVRRTMNIFRSMGVFKALRKAGVFEGQTVIISGYEFEYYPDDEDEDDD